MYISTLSDKESQRLLTRSDTRKSLVIGDI